jgi:DNA primase
MAGRIPQQFIDQLLDRVDIVELIDSRVALRKSGRNFMACCPFHDEKSPSFSVQPEKQFYYCFGCGAGGNALGFLMDYDRLEFPAAVEYLAQKCGMEVPRAQESEQQKAQQAHKQDLYSELAKADRYYRAQLRQHATASEAVNYLKGRGLSGEIAARFGIGYAPPGWDNLLKTVQKDQTATELLLESGMLVSRDDRRVYDRFRHRIMFPIRDSRGRTIAFGGRVLGDDKPKYLNSPETPIFHKGSELYGLYEARQANKYLERIVVVEGYMDVIALAQAGISYAVATLGTATSGTHLDRIYRHCSEVVFCFDGDEAGRQAARRGLETALPVVSDGQQVRFLFLPEGEDPDTLVRKEGSDAFVERLATAMPLSEYLLSLAAEGLDIATPDGKAAMSKNALAWIKRMGEGLFKELMLNELSQRTGLSSDALHGLALQAPAESYYEPGMGEPAGVEPEIPAYHPEPMRREALPEEIDDGTDEISTLAETALALLLYKPSLAARVSDLESLLVVQEGRVQLLVEVMALLHKRPESSTGILIGHWYGTEQGELLHRLCGQGIELLKEGVEALGRSGGDESEFEQGLEQQFLDALDKMLNIHLQRQRAMAIRRLTEGGALTPEQREEIRALLRKTDS